MNLVGIGELARRIKFTPVSGLAFFGPVVIKFAILCSLFVKIRLIFFFQNF